MACAFIDLEKSIDTAFVDVAMLRAAAICGGTRYNYRPSIALQSPTVFLGRPLNGKEIE
jgi:hypothetical protein